MKLYKLNKNDKYEFNLFTTNINLIKNKQKIFKELSCKIHRWDPTKNNVGMLRKYSSSEIEKIFLFHSIPQSNYLFFSKKNFFKINSYSHIEIINTLYSCTKNIYFISSILSVFPIKYKKEYSSSKKIVENYISKNNLVKCKIFILGPVKTGFDNNVFNFLSSSSAFISKRIFYSLNLNKQIIFIPRFWYLILPFVYICKLASYLRK